MCAAASTNRRAGHRAIKTYIAMIDPLSPVMQVSDYEYYGSGKGGVVPGMGDVGGRRAAARGGADAARAVDARQAVRACQA